MAAVARVWLKAAVVARAVYSGTAEEWLCRLGRARHRQGLVSAVAGANRGGGGCDCGYGHWRLRATAVQAQ